MMGEINLSRIMNVAAASLPRKPLRVLGIDLGTTNSVVAEAIWDPSRPDNAQVRCLEIEQPTATEGTYISTLMPSVIALLNGKEFVGEGAKRLVAASAEYELKRNRQFFFETKNEIGTARRYGAAPEGYRNPTEIASHILARLIKEAGGSTPDCVVVTVPASFQAAQRRETIRAAELAGIDVAQGGLLDEPVAAFMDYVAGKAENLALVPGRQANLLVFDFGGGTCDIALFSLSHDKDGTAVGIAPRAISRFHRLGGGDIDAAIVYDVLIPQFMSQNGLERLALGYAAKKQYVEPALRNVAEQLKIGLSKEIERQRSLNLAIVPSLEKVIATRRRIILPDRELEFAAPRLTLGEMTRVLDKFLDQFSQAPSSDEYRMAQSIFAPIDDALMRAELDADDIDFCLLAGGSAGMPQVVDALGEYFANAKLLRYENAEDRKETIARGAALQALSLALVGRPLVEPICQDEIAIQTEGGAIVLVKRGESLPFPANGGYAVSNRLALPTDSEAEPIEMRVSVVAGEERRVLFSQPWDVPAPTSRGEPLRLEYRYDANQVLELRLMRAEQSRSAPFEATIENPLSHVVNPQLLELKAEEIEQEIGPGSHLPREGRLQRAYELAGLLEELGRREKALDYIKTLLRERALPEVDLYNRMGNILSEMNAPDQAERAYRDAMKASPTASGPVFNLALLLRRLGTAEAAAEAADEAVRRNPSGAYLTLRALIANDMNDEALRDELLAKASKKFGAVSGLSEWELGWLRTCATLMGDREKEAAVKAELKDRTGSGADDTGELPVQVS